MKTPRFFILVGACAFLITSFADPDPFQRSSAEAGPLPIRWYEPRAGDPDEPIPAYSMSLESDEFNGISTSSSTTTAAPSRELQSSSTSFERLWRRLSLYLFSWSARR
jgi:hypothetical protein